jgi:NAD-dependent SIR2 family protein deacetylase
MATQGRTETVKASFELGDRKELLRIGSGIREAECWVKKRAHCRGDHAGAYCRGCYQKIDSGTLMVWEEDMNCYSQLRRNRYWHRECHPDWVNREFDRLRRRVSKQLTSGGSLWG